MGPANETELAELIRGANGPLDLRGGGTRVAWRPLRGEVVSTAGLSGVHLYEPGALTLVVGAGTPVAEVERVLAEKGQRLAFEPMDARGLMGTDGVPTIGGVIAANASGPRRVQAGAARDVLLGVRFVDGAGQVVKNGGATKKACFWRQRPCDSGYWLLATGYWLLAIGPSLTGMPRSASQRLLSPT